MDATMVAAGLRARLLPSAGEPVAQPRAVAGPEEVPEVQSWPGPRPDREAMVDYPLVFTHSDIEAFLRCRRLFTLGYVMDYQEPEVEWGALALGRRVHASIDALYRTGADPVAEHDHLGRMAIAGLPAMSPSPPPWAENQLYDDIIVGRNCVLAYMTWLEDTGADDGYDVVASERMIEAPILDGKVLLRGKVDRQYMRRRDGAVIVDDLKTSAPRRAGLRERLERAYQHHVYLAILRKLMVEGEPRPEGAPPAWVAGAWYTVIFKFKRLERAAPPLVARWPTPATVRVADAKLAQIERICLEMLQQIDRVRDMGAQVAGFPTPQEACRWCAFRGPCEVMDESEAAAVSMLEVNFHRGRRHERYGSVV